MHTDRLAPTALAGLLALAALLGAPSPANAQEPGMAPPPATHWSCWYAGQARIECRLRSGVDHPDAPLPSLHGAAGNFLQLLRRQATRLLGRPVYIPLLGEPVDHEDLPALAQAVLCGTQAGCHAQYHPDPLAAFAGWSAEAFADLHDPLLAPDDEG